MIADDNNFNLDTLKTIFSKLKIRLENILIAKNFPNKIETLPSKNTMIEFIIDEAENGVIAVQKFKQNLKKNC